MLFRMLILVIITGFLPYKKESSSVTFVGSTPGDAYIKDVFGIGQKQLVDFIRWELVFSDPDKFSLSIRYGESQPNTLGFKQGGQEKKFSGSYTIRKTPLGLPALHLKGEGLNGDLILGKVNNEIYHILDNNNRLLVGNGGWSYCLNRESGSVSATSLSSLELIDTASVITFDGRTPCQEFALEYNKKENPECFKVKWRLILKRDPRTHEPTTYIVKRRIVYDIADTTGKWAIRRVGNANIIVLNPDIPSQSISLLQLDRNVLYFLRRNGVPYKGNDDFSFALNRINR